ncbi:MAG: hypothetical protein CR974_02935 [Gammaproteobacteria bacterium]|nr:MAG: hypothetical protein CR974_02935 [Gammaproteobacteria bacterium]
MSYHVLARKWRPQTFADLVGQTHVVKALTYALSHQQIHHAYLFTGTRGVGKTSIARIFAKSLNCETNGISPNPCGECETCKEIKAGKFVDLIEVDAASRTGVEETRELIESVAYLPSKGRYKVYLIDEVHMFSKSSFNALLKTLEEPPEHVKFILATTDPEKLPITILSRCLQFNLKSLTPAQIRQHLANICAAESIPYDEDALGLLASAGDGSMRDTLSITDQAIAYGHGQLRLSAVTEILGTIHPNDIEAILFAIATNNPNQLSQALHRLDDYEVDARTFLIEMMRRLQQMAWAKEGIANNLSPALQSTVNDIPKTLLHLWYDIAEKALPNLGIAGEPRQAVEMALLRMIAFIPDDWIARHRTLLDTQGEVESETPANVRPVKPKPTTTTQPAPTAATSTTAPASTAPLASTNATPEPPRAAPTQQPPAQQQPTELPSNLVVAQATPVTEHDSLDSAEAAFSGQADSPARPTPMPVENDAPNPTDDSAHLNPHTSEDWHLSSEDSAEPTPSMDDIRAMMQSGRDISPPNTAASEPAEASASARESATQTTPDTAITTESTEPAKRASADFAVTPAQPSDNDTPPWEEMPAATEHVADVATEAPVLAPAPASEPTPAPVPPIDRANFNWPQTLKMLPLDDYTYHVASLGILRLNEAGNGIQAVLDLPPKHELLVTEESLQTLAQALEKGLNVPITVQIRLTMLDEPTPHDLEKQSSDQQRADLQTDFQQEPLTQQVLASLEGRILTQTVKRKN